MKSERDRYYVILTSLLSAADNIHTAMCRMGNNMSQSFLLDAFHSALIGMEECRQGLVDCEIRDMNKGATDEDL